ncbi:hypothetical protein F9K94_17325 [Brucella tritici]|uniref:Uncharacterized protein n=1 Tax=Brucella tritici TaxID=94626 RepID=A0A7V8B1P5_9HYPH|nr:hypothetical protein [Brucella tritici]KAB2656264.1 hypothetical protein F9K94_17325 [Brucella tritici]
MGTHISEDVLNDWHNRTVISVSNLHWVDANNTMLDCSVLFEELEPLGAIPFTTCDSADTHHGRLIWERALRGDYGKIAPFIKPTPEEQRARMPNLEKWRVDTIIDLELGLRDKINAAIDKWPEPKRTISKNKFKSVTNFSRLDPLFDDVGADPEVGKTPEDIDAMWAAGAALPPSLT